MREGFYSVAYQGVAGAGFGMMVLDTDLVVGADAVGGTYDGSYRFNPSTNMLDLKVEVTIPAGVWLVTGIPAQSTPYKLNITASVPRDLGKEHPVAIPTPLGAVSVVFKKVRDFPN
jgi:hypothetical protein